MNIRDALIYQSPSLELQRAAADEIAALDGDIAYYCTELHKHRVSLEDLTDFLEDLDLWDTFEYWKNRNTEE